jgi:hypothetical protein
LLLLLSRSQNLVQCKKVVLAENTGGMGGIGIVPLQVLDNIRVLATLVRKMAGMNHMGGHVLALGLGELLRLLCRENEQRVTSKLDLEKISPMEITALHL